MQCEALFNEIDKLEEKYLSMLETVCNLESPTDCKEGVDAVGAYFVQKAKEMGWDTEVFTQTVSGNVVTITQNKDTDQAPIAVSGHMDTVHPVGSFGTPAVQRDGENMYGPGVMDCKGGAVAAFMAMEALKNCGFRGRPVQLFLQSDEENGSASSQKATIRYICEKAKNAVAFLNLEGISGNTAVLQRKGILRYHFKVQGKALHSARCAEASNAIAEAAHKIIALEQMKDAAGLTCNCGVIHGGTIANTVAEECSFYADIRFATMGEAQKAREKVREIADTVFVPGCTGVIEEVSYRPPMQYCERNEKLLESMNRIYAENQLPILKPRACLSGSDAAYVTESGIPCVDSLGTEGSNIHSVHEYIKLRSLAEAAKRIAAVAYCI